jgi:N-hydroxyarylamine O-acetyltransferase
MSPTTPLSSEQVRGYLERLRLTEAPQADAAGLAQLHRAHLLSVPFENLDIHLGRPLSLSLDDLYSKIVERRRGGFCYELNGLFAALLETLGFVVYRMSARVNSQVTGVLGHPFDHLCLRVLLAEPWLCDVGFGRGFLRPLHLTNAAWQSDGQDDYRIQAGAPEWTLENRERLLYVFDPTPRRLVEFEPMCSYHQTSPDSPFLRGRLWTIATERGRVTLRGDTYVLEVDGVVSERKATLNDWSRVRGS